MLRVVVEDEAADAESADGLDEIVRVGARRMLVAALEAEVEAYLAGFADQVDERGRRLVVRNGHARPRAVTTAAGAIEVAAPRVNDKRVDPVTGERVRFRSVILPPWCRRSPKVTEVLPLLYLHGLSTGDFVPALEEFFGSAAGLSASVVTRLTADWQAEQRAFAQRDLSGVDYVYVWVDGVHFTVRLDEARLCTLVMVGCARTGPRSWSPSPTGIGSRPSRGRTCSATAAGAGCARRCWWSVTARWGSGPRCVRCSRPPGSSDAG
jgi:putative transposase